jgi:hypothetical protein
MPERPLPNHDYITFSCHLYLSVSLLNGKKRATRTRSPAFTCYQRLAIYCDDNRKNTVGLAGLIVTLTGLTLPPG